MTKNSTYLRIAIQKSGRLGDESLILLKKAGFKISVTSRALLARATDFPLELLFLRVGDIPEIIADGLADLGIVGENSLEEKNFEKITVLEKLGFGKCTLCLAAPESSDIKQINDFNDKVVATSYPNILKNYFAENNISAEVVTMSGSVEIAPQLDIADAICDIVSTGSTLVANRLKNIGSIFSSQAVLITGKSTQELQKKQFNDFLLRLHSVLNARNLKSVVLNAPRKSLDKIIDILPGLESPTITPLSNSEWVAVHSVVKEDEKFWNRITRLKEAGAEGILVMPVERVIF